MKYSTRIVSTIVGSLIALFVAGCNKPDDVDNTLVEVRVVGLWTDADFARSTKASVWNQTWYPHTIVEDTATRERYRILGNSLGTTGDVFTVKRSNLKNAGQ
jgi:hypothetical protein